MSPIQVHPRQLMLDKLSGSHIRREGTLPHQKLGVTSGSVPAQYAFLSDGIGGAYWGNFGGEFAHKITVFHRSGSPAEYFDVTDTGWDLAAAACYDWDTITSPPAVYSLAHTVPANVGYWGHGPGPTLHTAMLTYSVGAIGMDHIIIVSASSTGEAIGIAGPATGTAWINRVSVGITQAGSGSATGVKAGAGTLVLRDVPTEATAQGVGLANALTCSEGGIVEIYESPMEGIAGGSGSAYGVYVEDGDVSIWGGKCLGTTSSFYRRTE